MRYSLILMLFIATGSMAQTPPAQQTSPLQDLKQYVILTDTLNKLTGNLQNMFTKLSKGDASITPKRYAQLSPYTDNQAKLTELKATPGEVAYLKKAGDISRKESNDYTTAFQSLVEAYGKSKYKSFQEKLKTDPRLKRSYDSLVALKPQKVTK